AATAAALALDAGVPVQELDYAKLRERLLADKQILTWDKPFSPSYIPKAAPQGIPTPVSKATLKGDWTASTSGNYLHDSNEGKGEKSATYAPNFKEDGHYEVHLRWTSHGNRATQVPVSIQHAGGTEKLSLNQQKKGTWHRIFTGHFKAGEASSLVISNTGTDGYVIADEVRWVPVPAKD
ncbi:MAG: FAD-dependent oxidoreductase, partial [Verrucomicrobiales bacterium]